MHFKFAKYFSKHDRFCLLVLLGLSTLVLSLSFSYGFPSLHLAGPKDLHPSGLQVVDMKNFSFKIHTDICGHVPVSIMTLVSSALRNKAARSTIRSTWGRPSLSGARLGFLLGATQDTQLQQQVENESRLYGDIIQGNFVDVYRNLTYKTVMGHMWVSIFCSQAEVVVKADDDSYIDMYAVFFITRPHLHTEQYRIGSWMMGPTRHGNSLHILRNGKWSVTNEEVDPSIKEYPIFGTGSFYIINVATAIRLVEAAKVTKYLYLEDVFVTGFLRQQLNITMIDTMVYETRSQNLLLKQKMVQSVHTYRKDHINGLLDRDVGYNRTCSLISRYSKWCYVNRCLNNIYYPEYKPSKDETFENFA